MYKPSSLQITFKNADLGVHFSFRLNYNFGRTYAKLLSCPLIHANLRELGVVGSD
jgi:hypothetical protein